MNIVLYIEIIFFIMLGVGLYKFRQDDFDRFIGACVAVSGVILFSLHLVLQVFL
ncbi:hypothetical protein vBSscSF1_113 [Staphylococcus phage vB-SscS-F1]|nr:hypothetical protein vBApySJF1_113 [Arcanobacterium phage vB-ApyS-JF1]